MLDAPFVGPLCVSLSFSVLYAQFGERVDPPRRSFDQQSRVRDVLEHSRRRSGSFSPRGRSSYHASSQELVVPSSLERDESIACRGESLLFGVEAMYLCHHLGVPTLLTIHLW